MARRQQAGATSLITLALGIPAIFFGLIVLQSLATHAAH